MSISFKFPSWHCRISNGGVEQDDGEWEKHALCGRNWDADLDSLDGIDGESDDFEGGTPKETDAVDSSKSQKLSESNLMASSFHSAYLGSNKALCVADHIPSEVLLLVMTYLPIRDVSNCSMVCKEWHRSCTDDSQWNIFCKTFEQTGHHKVPVDNIAQMQWLKNSQAMHRVCVGFVELKKGY
eukprot:8688449-Pyramimonas_sp.AAC.1